MKPQKTLLHFIIRGVTAGIIIGLCIFAAFVLFSPQRAGAFGADGSLTGNEWQLVNITDPTTNVSYAATGICLGTNVVTTGAVSNTVGSLPMLIRPGYGLGFTCTVSNQSALAYPSNVVFWVRMHVDNTTNGFPGVLGSTNVQYFFTNSSLGEQYSTAVFGLTAAQCEGFYSADICAVSNSTAGTVEIYKAEWSRPVPWASPNSTSR